VRDPGIIAQQVGPMTLGGLIITWRTLVQVKDIPGI
jgi:hypothetical protein